MEGSNRRKSLEKFNIKKLKALCDNLSIKFKSKWRKLDYINNICDYYQAVSDNAVENQENNLSLSHEAVLDLDTTGSENQRSKPETFTTSTPNPKAKKKAELKFNTRVHKYFQEKCGCDAPQPDYIFHWIKNPHPSVIPSITAIEIFDYLVQRRSDIDNCCNRNIRGFNRAVAHIDANDITGGIEYCLVESQFLYIKSRCYPSMRLDSYRVVACIDSVDGTICGGACECVVGLSGGCSHVGALLLFLEKYSTLKDEEFAVSCTSKLCAWNGPKTKVVTPKRMREMSFEKPKLHSGRKLIGDQLDAEESRFAKFDPRHPDDREMIKKRCISAIRDLLNIYPQSGAAHFWDLDNEPENYVSPPEPNIEVEITTTELPDEVQTEKSTNANGVDFEEKIKELIFTPSATYETNLKASIVEDFAKKQFLYSRI